jgi:hypothetical protein
VEGRSPICKRLRSPRIDSARLQRLAEPFPWNRFLGSLNVYKFGLRSWKNRENIKQRKNVRDKVVEKGVGVIQDVNVWDNYAGILVT